MKKMLSPQLKAIAVAFVFASRIPMPKLDSIAPEDSSRSLPWFLFVGVILGIILSLLGSILQPANPQLVAAILLTTSAMFTGGLHLDGVADSADSWLAGGDKARSLEIMKDPRCGSGAVVTLVILLLLQWVALSELITEKQWLAIFMAPIVGRAALLSIFMSTPYARAQGSASDFINEANRPLIIGLIFITVAACLLYSTSSLIAILVTAVVVFLCRRLMITRLEGCTGDTAGAMTEIGAMTFWVSWALLF